MLGRDDWQEHGLRGSGCPQAARRLAEDVREAAPGAGPRQVTWPRRRPIRPANAVGARPAPLARWAQARSGGDGLGAGHRAWAGTPGRPCRQALALRRPRRRHSRPESSAALLGGPARIYLERLGDQAVPTRRPGRRQPPAPRDHYELARTAAFNRRYAEAVAELNRRAGCNPRHYWSWLQRGMCHQELGEHALAVGDFSACIALWPEFAWGYFNRGWRPAHQLGKKAEALADFTAALEPRSRFRAGPLQPRPGPAGPGPPRGGAGRFRPGGGPGAGRVQAPVVPGHGPGEAGPARGGR